MGRSQMNNLEKVKLNTLLNYIMQDISDEKKYGFYCEEAELNIKSDERTVEIFNRSKKYKIKHSKSFIAEYKKAKKRLEVK